MPEKRYCEICGGEIWGRAQRVIIEGVEVLACTSCASMGKRVTPKKSYRRGATRDARRRPSRSTSSMVFKKSEYRGGKSKKRYDERNLEVMSGYGKLIRRIRDKHKLTQEELADKLNEKESLIRKIEAERVEPTIKLAKRIEKRFGVKILKEIDDEPILTQQDRPKSPGPATLGDMIVFKKKKKKK